MNNIIFHNLLFYLNDIEYINLSLLNKDLNNYIKNDNTIYEYFFNKKFSKKFTSILKIISCNFYISYKKIYLFEKNLLKIENNLWNEDQYYEYWKIYYNLKL